MTTKILRAISTQPYGAHRKGLSLRIRSNGSSNASFTELELEKTSHRFCGSTVCQVVGKASLSRCHRRRTEDRSCCLFTTLRRGAQQNPNARNATKSLRSLPANWSAYRLINTIFPRCYSNTSPQLKVYVNLGIKSWSAEESTWALDRVDEHLIPL